MSRFKFDEAVRAGEDDTTTSDDGLDKLRASLAKGIRPQVAKPRPDASTIRQVAIVGQSQGFLSREPTNPDKVIRPTGRRPAKEPQSQVSIKGPQRVINAFKNLCNDEDVTSWEGLELLLNNYQLNRDGSVD